MTAAMSRFGLERRPMRLADMALAIWIGVLVAVTVYGAATTTGFLTWSNFKAILTAASFVGIIAVGLTVIILSGNLFSLALGQTAAVSAMVFLYALRFDLGVAIVLTLLLGLAIGAVQGFAVGAWGANPIIITIGAAGLLEGMAVWLSSGQSIVPPVGATSWERLANPVLGLACAGLLLPRRHDHPGGRDAPDAVRPADLSPGREPGRGPCGRPADHAADGRAPSGSRRSTPRARGS